MQAFRYYCILFLNSKISILVQERTVLFSNPATFRLTVWRMTSVSTKLSFACANGVAAVTSAEIVRANSSSVIKYLLTDWCLLCSTAMIFPLFRSLATPRRLITIKQMPSLVHYVLWPKNGIISWNYDCICFDTTVITITVVLGAYYWYDAPPIVRVCLRPPDKLICISFGTAMLV